MCNARPVQEAIRISLPAADKGDASDAAANA